MDTTLVQIFVGYLLISWTLGIVQNLTNCQKQYEYYGFNIHFVNVCQDNNRRLESGTPGVIVIDSAGAPLRQDIECKCYLNFNQQQEYMQVYFTIHGGDRQDVAFEINGQDYQSGSTLMNIASGTELLFRQGCQRQRVHVCVGISKAMLRGSLTIQCQANQTERKRSTTIERPTATTKRPPTTTERPTITTKRPPTTTDRPTATTKRPTLATQRTHSMSSNGSITKKTALPAMPEKTSTRATPNKTALPAMPEKTSIPSTPQMTSIITTQNEKARSMGPPTGIVIGTATCAVLVLALIVVGIKALVWRRKRKSNRTPTEHDEPVPTYYNVANHQTADASSHSLVSSQYVNVRLPRDPSSSTVSNTYESLQNQYNREDDHYYSTALY